ncbi:MAG: carboxylating nicotinate-nucleotide diphosphorylase [Acidobacteriota bacterium]
MPFDVEHPEIAELVRRALAEDIGPGDVTSDACVPAHQRATGRFIAREKLVVAGPELLPLIYRLRGGVDKLRLEAASGAALESGQSIASVRGLTRTLLECERVALNFLQRLSGVATLARRYAEAVAGAGCKVLDTRKTTPGLRRLEKMAAAAGGIMNHRMGLYDAVLIKNNHIIAAGGVRAAIERARSAGLPIEIEVRTRQELEAALECGVARVLIDNLTAEQAAAEVAFVAGRAAVELSGGITLENVRAYAQTGADFVSSGALTHSAPAVDINFRLELA